jgi:hypothetical protein
MAFRVIVAGKKQYGALRAKRCSSACRQTVMRKIAKRPLSGNSSPGPNRVSAAGFHLWPFPASFSPISAFTVRPCGLDFPTPHAILRQLLRNQFPVTEIGRTAARRVSRCW